MLGRNGEKTVFDGFDGAVDYCVDGVYDVVDEGLFGGDVSWGDGARGIFAVRDLPEECSGSVR